MDRRRSTLFQRKERRLRTIRHVKDVVATVVGMPNAQSHSVQPAMNRKAIKVLAKAADALMVVGPVVIQSSRRWM
jgi:hypothetical protein